jgi:hypothetical protein
MTEFSRQVTEYIENDRQWPRQHRINHAKMQLARLAALKAAGVRGFPDENFWRAVINRNED